MHDLLYTHAHISVDCSSCVPKPPIPEIAAEQGSFMSTGLYVVHQAEWSNCLIGVALSVFGVTRAS